MNNQTQFTSPARPCRFLARISSPALLLILMAVYLLIVFVLFPAMASGMSNGPGPLDLKFYYSPETAYEMIEAYGPQGRENYRLGALTVDVIYPLVYSMMFSVWLTLLLAPGKTSTCIFQMLPVSILIADLLENSGVVAMLSLYPQRYDKLAVATSLLTSLKWLLAAVVIIATLILTLYKAGKYLLNRC